MTVSDDLEAARASLVMINPAPCNAEAPLAALIGDITPTELHYVRSNFAVPAHDGTRRHGHPRVRRQRATRHEAATDRRTLGRPRRLYGTMDRRTSA